MNIYEQISSNKTRTWVIVAGFVTFISFCGYAIGEYYMGYGYGIPTMLMAVLFSGVSSFSSYFFSDKIALGLAGAKKVSSDQMPYVFGIVENLCIGAGLKDIPQIYVINDSAPNAFATGRDPKHASIAVTSGLLGKLTKRELEGVLAHELSHIRNYDIRLMTITAVLVGSITIIANIMYHSGFSGRKSSNRSSGGIVIVIGLILALLSPIIANLIKLAVSRTREYLADASAALLTRDPEGLALALEKISDDSKLLEVASEATAHMYFSNPLKKGENADFFANMFNTHPPVKERISRLRSM